MSESGRSTDFNREIKEKEHRKHHHDHSQGQALAESQEAPDPYCCTPPGGEGGPDTKP